MAGNFSSASKPYWCKQRGRAQIKPTPRRCDVCMAASLVVASAELQVLETNSFIRGYHKYTDVWVPFIGESLLVKPEPTNAKDNKAVAVNEGLHSCRSCTTQSCTASFSLLKMRCQQSVCCGPRRESEQRRRLWPGSALYLPPVRPTCLCLPNERTS